MSTPIPATQARHNLSQNPYHRWYKAGASPTDAGGGLAFQRLRKPVFVPKIIPKFTMSRSDKVFAIGSCFARGIENALVGHHIEVLSRSTDFESFPAAGNELKLGVTNKYNTFSIYNDLRWALDPAARFPRESLVPLAGGTYYDPHTNPSLQLAGLDETLRRREIMGKATRRIKECRIVIVTLGLTEIWRDTVAGVVTNTTPEKSALDLYPDRYEFRVSTFAENMENLERVHALLTTFGHPDLQVVVTVSPVPLMATHTEDDVVVANTLSKSTLRAAAQEWTQRHRNVHYFPSYEMVMNSERRVAWEEDLRHVRGEMALEVMQHFLDHYLAEPTAESNWSEPVSLG